MKKNKRKSKRTFSTSIKTRRQLRKEKRQQKKLKRNEHYSNKNNEKISNTSSPKQINRSSNQSNKSISVIDEQLKQNQKDAVKFKKLTDEMKLHRLKQLQEANEKEDRLIKTMEKKLKLNKRKNKLLPKSFINEGLDYILEVCDNRHATDFEKEMDSHELANDFASITESSLSKRKNSSDSNISYESDDCSNFSGSDIDFDIGSDENSDDIPNHDISSKKTNPKRVRFTIESEKITDDPKPKRGEKSIVDTEQRLKNLRDFVQKGTGNIDTDAIDESKNESSNEKIGFIENKNKSKFQEDIYGRLRDADGNIIENNRTKYVPPQLRFNNSKENTATSERLNKLMKGHLNRLTESNMHSIATEIEDLYMSHSRNDTTCTLVKLLKNSLVLLVLSPERLVIEHALLISVLHANVGSEIGAQILLHLIQQLQKMFEENVLVEDKRIDNLILILSNMYNFKIFHAHLIYEILNKLVERFHEKDIELILLILKNVGFSLRKDDPAALKQLILNVQKKANDSPQLREDARVRFMLDTLLAVKNNNMLKIPGYDPTYVEHLKKVQKSLLRSGKYVAELKISLDDLLNAETKGKWWIVGSAWNCDEIKKTEHNDENLDILSFDKKILQLAKTQRMNTDARRNIFCILMTAEDYLDAFEKLIKLGLKGQQYREIIHVLMHCMLKEKQYNPYYSFLAEQFCSLDRKYQLALQFCAWDKFKEINSFSDQQIRNLAKFLSYLFLELKLSLSILKIFDFTEMNKHLLKLIRQILLLILLNDNEKLVADIFSRISKSEKLCKLRGELQLFLHHFMRKNIGSDVTVNEEELKLLPKRVELAVNAMQPKPMQGSKSDFDNFKN